MASLGFIPVCAPLLRIRQRDPRLPDPDILQAALATSANALPALAQRHSGLPLYVVGDATAAEARARGFSSVTSAAGDAAALAALVGRTCSPAAGPLLLAAGAGRGEELVAVLRAAGFMVRRRTVYAVRPVSRLPAPARTALAGGTIRAALFYSNATAETFVRLVTTAGLAQTLGAVEAVAIGAAAAATLRPLPFRAVRVALRPTEEALLAMLE